jgi:hypothetical protein
MNLLYFNINTVEILKRVKIACYYNLYFEVLLYNKYLVISPEKSQRKVNCVK